MDLRRVKSAKEIPMAVHGTTYRAWESIGLFSLFPSLLVLRRLSAKQGLSRMSRNHIHLAQGFTGDVISGVSIVLNVTNKVKSLQ